MYVGFHVNYNIEPWKWWRTRESGANVETFDDKSEWNKSIHRTKAMFTIFLAISFGEKNLKFL